MSGCGIDAGGRQKQGQKGSRDWRRQKRRAGTAGQNRRDEKEAGPVFDRRDSQGWCTAHPCAARSGAVNMPAEGVL
jgi:hypothetical protein